MGPIKRKAIGTPWWDEVALAGPSLRSVGVMNVTYEVWCLLMNVFQLDAAQHKLEYRLSTLL